MFRKIMNVVRITCMRNELKSIVNQEWTSLTKITIFGSWFLSTIWCIIFLNMVLYFSDHTQWTLIQKNHDCHYDSLFRIFQNCLCIFFLIEKHEKLWTWSFIFLMMISENETDATLNIVHYFFERGSFNNHNRFIIV